MKTMILYYTFKGSSEKKAKELAKEIPNCDMCKIEEKKTRTMLNASMVGCPKAMLRKASKIQPITYDLKSYDKIILIAPIWSSYPAPAFNSMVQMLPEKKDVEVYLCSSSGNSSKSKEGTIKLISKKGCNVLDYHDVKTNVNITG